ncbi:MAG TPA: DUF962 domain-containing protein [Bdellovibrionota bacterium]|jgi:hypothetical protein
MNDSGNISSYKAFWPVYVSFHQNKVNRNFHFVGATFGAALFWLGFTRHPAFFLAMPVCGYGFGWFGHMVFEKNRPATFQYPLWSFLAFFQMIAFMCLGRMDREVRRMGVLNLET